MGQESGLRSGSKGGCGQDTLKERKIEKKQKKSKKKKDNENENKNRENKKQLIVRMAQ